MATQHIEIDIPEEILREFNKSDNDLSQHALEALAAEGYRSGILTTGQVQLMLKLSSRPAVDSFLKQHGCYLEYTEEDLDKDVAAIRQSAHR